MLAEHVNWTEQVIAICGAFVVLSAYAGHQLKWPFFNPEKIPYNAANAIASVLLTYAAFHPLQMGFVLMEGAWGLISLYTLSRIVFKRSA